MKKLYLGLLSFILMLIQGCVPESKEVMPLLEYQKLINVHIPKNVHLNWVLGEQHVSVERFSPSLDEDITLAATLDAIEMDQRKNDPESYTYAYGKAQQEVFMNSLKNILEEHHIFKHVSMIMTPQKNPAKDLVMTIYFKSTRVLPVEEGHRINLDVVVTIKSDDKTLCHQTYFVQNSPDKAFTRFKIQQTDVSMQLLEKILLGIKRCRQLS